MAIQVRRGQSADYDPAKMLEGELAVCLDTDDLYFKGTNSKKVLNTGGQTLTDDEQANVLGSLGSMFTGSFTIPANGSVSITPDANTRGYLLCTALNATVTTWAVLGIAAQSGNLAYIKEVVSDASISVSRSGGTVTIANGSNYTCTVLYIANKKITVNQ